MRHIELGILYIDLQHIGSQPPLRKPVGGNLIHLSFLTDAARLTRSGRPRQKIRGPPTAEIWNDLVAVESETSAGIT